MELNDNHRALLVAGGHANTPEEAVENLCFNLAAFVKEVRAGLALEQQETTQP